MAGAGKHFSAGHDIGTPDRDVDKTFDRASLWYDHTNKVGGEFLYAREHEVYLGMCRRWREIPKPTIAMEFLFLGERMSAQRAYQMGMLNRVVSREALQEETLAIAGRIAKMPRLGLQLTKQAINNAEDLMGKRTTMDMVFGLHHFAHAHNDLVSGDRLAGFDGRSMAASQRETSTDKKKAQA
ncbi:enoyl-CoA hydratase-related protein [Endozoicomonas sp. SCSIO W0465]|uniref:enoyl-CoA hydratase-related protein n=1 Tax=Endozoicomonas sp. SCSIO W0465 TaxID=2918516 RepID=UPI0020751186|nr:enoyl-CoA hydratase-related protein [Endozoicomonas sp. SCSIO W0465]USE34923.1 enoyl-CoA hydratase-related protein [Endozoicomonas sp. SCSIO W0465]